MRSPNIKPGTPRIGNVGRKPKWPEINEMEVGEVIRYDLRWDRSYDDQIKSIHNARSEVSWRYAKGFKVKGNRNGRTVLVTRLK